MGPIISPMYWTAEEASKTKITKKMIIEKRKWLLKLLNEKDNDISCKHCGLVEKKLYRDVCLTKLGHVNLAHFSLCNLRCNFCSYTQRNEFYPAQYDALEILREFKATDVVWDSHVDLNGGEPTLLKNLKSYIDYFTNNAIRILLYTNSVHFNEYIYGGLKNGTITWVITSLDAGTQSTFRNLKGRDKFTQVMENLTRYAHAGSSGGGMLAVKYIFCVDNCDDHDISGFTYAMLAIRPQKIWLTFDFNPLSKQYSNHEGIQIHDYSKQIEAYVRMYLMMKKHGLEATHFAKVHLANVLQEGEDLMERVNGAIQNASTPNVIPDKRLIIDDFRQSATGPLSEPNIFDCRPLKISTNRRKWKPWSLVGKRVLLAPACSLSKNLLTDESIRESQILGFLDRDPVLHRKSIDGFKIYPYKAIKEMSPDVILVASADQYKKDILGTVNKYANRATQICVLEK